MNTYTLKDNPGCVVEEFTAVQFKGDTTVIREVHPHLDWYQATATGAVVVIDRRGSFLTLEDDWIICDSEGKAVIMSDSTFRRNFQETVNG